MKKKEVNNVPRIIELRHVLVLDEEIGRGSFGGCSLGRYGSRDVIIKKPLQQGSENSFENEARYLHRLRHPNIAELIGIIETGSKIFLVLNYYNVDGVPLTLGSDLQALHIELKKIFSGFFEAVEYLHEHEKVLHNDIKANNVSLHGSAKTKSDITAVLIDFGKARNVYDPKVYVTPADLKRHSYLAPELGTKDGKQSRKSYIYSLGFLIKYLSNSYDNFATELDLVYRACMRENPVHRPSASDLRRNLRLTGQV